MRKKNMLIAAVASLVVLATVGGTLAFFTDTETAVNVVTMGNVNIEIDEDPTNSIEDDPRYDFGYEFIEDGTGFKYTGVVPNDTVYKIADIHNIGANSAYVRLKIDTTITAANGDPLLSDGIRYMHTSPSTEGGFAERKFADDGYYYYEDILLDKNSAEEQKPDADCFEFLHHVLIPETWGNEYAGATIKINIIAEAIQSDNVEVGEVQGAEATKAAFSQIDSSDIIPFKK